MLINFKNFKSVIALSFISVSLCILTFLAFIKPKLLFISNINLQVLLVTDVILLIVFLSIIFQKSYSLYRLNKNKKIGSQTSVKYISLFAIFTFIPSFFIALFSLFIFNFALQDFFNDKMKQTGFDLLYMCFT